VSEHNSHLLQVELISVFFKFFLKVTHCNRRLIRDIFISVRSVTFMWNSLNVVNVTEERLCNCTQYIIKNEQCTHISILYCSILLRF